MYFLYILYSSKIDKFYIGVTADLEERIIKHNRKSKGFTNTGRPWIIVYSEPYADKKTAHLRETQLKNWKNRDRIVDLINTGSDPPDQPAG